TVGAGSHNAEQMIASEQRHAHPGASCVNTLKWARRNPTALAFISIIFGDEWLARPRHHAGQPNVRCPALLYQLAHAILDNESQLERIAGGVVERDVKHLNIN